MHYYIFVLVFLSIVLALRVLSYHCICLSIWFYIYLGEKLLYSLQKRNSAIFFRICMYNGTCSFSVWGYTYNCEEEHRIMYGNGAHDCWKLNKTDFFFRFYIFLYCVIFMLEGIMWMFWGNIFYCIKYTICNKNINLDLKYD